jgi:hypothetical protein
MPAGITFSVHDVQPRDTSLPVKSAAEAVEALVGARVIASSSDSGQLLAGVAHNPLVDAVHLAYAHHKRLVLSPDMIWLAVVQGVAHHVRLNAEELRGALVHHSGAKRISTVALTGACESLPAERWRQIVAEISSRMEKRLANDVMAFMAPEFSTTGETERTAFRINAMDAFQHYFDFVVYAICGIPEITLEGTTEDWDRIDLLVADLDRFGMEWWRDRLQPVCVQFARAAKGDVDREFWRRIYKIESGYGGDKVTGWIINLFPYLVDATGAPTLRNEFRAPQRTFIGDGDGLVDLGEVTEPSEASGSADAPDPGGLTLDAFPTGISAAPLTFVYPDGSSHRVSLIGGFVGVEQVSASAAVRPTIGWAASAPGPLDVLLDELESEQMTSAGSERFDTRFFLASGCPGELLHLYRRSNGLTIPDGAGQSVCRIRPIEETEPACIRTEYDEEFDEEVEIDDPYGRHSWMVFADLRDGSQVAFAYLRPGQWRYVRCRDFASEPPEYAQIVATSLPSLIAALRVGDMDTLPDLGDMIHEEA